MTEKSYCVWIYCPPMDTIARTAGCRRNSPARSFIRGEPPADNPRDLAALVHGTKLVRCVGREIAAFGTMPAIFVSCCCRHEMKEVTSSGQISNSL
jgi:hypothetical protein